MLIYPYFNSDLILFIHISKVKKTGTYYKVNKPMVLCMK